MSSFLLPMLCLGFPAYLILGSEMGAVRGRVAAVFLDAANRIYSKQQVSSLCSSQFFFSK